MFRGGGETYDLNIARGLSSLGHDVVFVTGRPLMASCNHPVTEFKTHYCRSPYIRDLITLVPVKGIGRVYLFDLMLFGIAAYRFIKRNAGSIDALYAQADPVLAYRVHRTLGIPTVVRFPGPPDRSLIEYIEKNSAVVASGDSLPKIKKMTGKEIIDIPPGVDVCEFRRTPNDLRSRFGIGDSQTVFLFVGRFVPVKNLLFLVDAFHMASKVNEDIRLILVGEGADYKKVSLRADTLELRDKLFFTGHVDHAELSQYYSAADALVLPSKYESFSIVTLEAMSCELPVIASNRGYLPQLIQEGSNGFLMDPEDVSSLSTALLRLAENPQLRLSMGRRNRLIAEKDFTWSSRATKYQELFLGIKQDKNGTAD